MVVSNQRVISLLCIISVLCVLFPENGVRTVVAAPVQDKTAELNIIPHPLALTGEAAFAVTERGELQTWGGTPPPPLTDVISISASRTYRVALHRDGHISVWGDTPIPPLALNDVIAVAAGDTHLLALRNDGTVIGWGDNTAGQISIPADLTDVVAIAAGRAHSLALTRDGRIIAWGDNSQGQCDVPPDLPHVGSIAAAADYSLIVSDTGMVTGWGDNTHKQLFVPQDVTRIHTVAAGQTHVVAISTDGTIHAWGDNTQGQTDIPAVNAAAMAVAAGDGNAMALLRDGQLVVWGNTSQTSIPANSSMLSMRQTSSRMSRASSPIRFLSGFESSYIPRNDDSYSGNVSIGFPINFYGIQYSSLYVNNNGNVTFDSPQSTFTPYDLTSTTRSIIAPFFADVDTRNYWSNVVTYGQSIVDGKRAFGVNYVDVGYFNSQADKLNSFQVILIDRSDLGTGNFDIEFNYETITWETGSASNGSNGFGGYSARAGYSNGTRISNTFFEIQGSAIPGSFLDRNAFRGLANTQFNSGVTGRFKFNVRNGVVNTPFLEMTSSKPVITVNQSATISVSLLQPYESFVVSYRNGREIFRGQASQYGNAAFTFTSPTPAQHELQVTGANGKVGYLTQYVVAATDGNISVIPCTINTVKPVGSFEDVLIMAPEVEQTYTLFVNKGNASSIQVAIKLNDNMLVSQLVNTGSNATFSKDVAVDLKTGNYLRLGSNSLSVTITGNNGCTDTKQFTHNVGQLPDWLTLASKPEICAYATIVSGTVMLQRSANQSEVSCRFIQIPNKFSERLRKLERFYKIVNKPEKVIDFINSNNSDETNDRDFEVVAAVRGTRVFFNLDYTSVDKVYKNSGKRYKTWTTLSQNIELAIKAEGELAIWQPANNPVTNAEMKGINVEGSVSLTVERSWPLLPVIAAWAPPVSAIVIPTLKIIPPVYDWVSARGEAYIEVKPRIGGGFKFKGRGLSADELTFIAKASISLKLGVRTDLWVAKADIHVSGGVELSANYKAIQDTWDFKAEFPLEAEISLEAFNYELKKGIYGKCYFPAPTNETDTPPIVCEAESRSIANADPDWQLPSRPDEQLFNRTQAEPRGLGDAIVYPIDGTHSTASSDIAVHTDGTATLVWEDDDTSKPVGKGYDIRFRQWNGSSWGTAQLITNDAYMDRSPSVAYMPDGSIMVVWERYDNPNGISASSTPATLSGYMGLMWSRYTSGTWSTPTWLVRTTVTSHLRPVLTTSTSGVWAVWQNVTGSIINPTATTISSALFSTGVWGTIATQPNTYARIRDITPTEINNQLYLSWTSAVTETQQLHVAKRTLSAITIPAPANGLSRPQFVAGTTPQLVWAERDTLAVAPADDMFNGNTATIVRQSDVFTGGLQLDEIVINRLANNDLVAVVAGARGGQRDLSIVRYAQDTRLWGEPRRLTDNPHKESSLHGSINSTGNIFLSFREDAIRYQQKLISGLPLTVPVELGTSIYAMRANLKRDVSLTLGDTVMLPDRSGAVITATITNEGDTFETLTTLVVNGQILPLTALNTPTFAPGQVASYMITVNHAQLQNGITAILNTQGGTDDITTNNSVSLPAQMPTLQLGLNAINPQFDGSAQALWSIENTSLLPVTTSTVQIKLGNTTIITNTVAPLAAGMKRTEIIQLPMRIVTDTTQTAVLSIVPSSGINAPQQLALPIVRTAQLQIISNSLVVTGSPSTRQYVTATIVNNGFTPSTATDTFMRAYPNVGMPTANALIGIPIPVLQPGAATQVTLEILPTARRCGLFLRLDGRDIPATTDTIAVPGNWGSCTDFTGAPIGGNPLSYQFLDRSTFSDITGWYWRFGDGKTSTLQNPTYQYKKMGTYLVQLTVNRPSGSNTFCKNIMVQPFATLTRTPSRTQTPSRTRTPSITRTPTPSNTPNLTQTATMSTTASPTATRTNTQTQTRTRTATLTRSSTPTKSLTRSRTVTRSYTQDWRRTYTRTRSFTRTPTRTPTRSNTRTPTPTATRTPLC